MATRKTELKIVSEKAERHDDGRPFLVFGKPDIGPLEEEAVLEVLRSGWIGTGPVARKFEEEFSSAMGGGYAVSTNSCTTGLMLAMRVANIGEGSEVITTPLTFAATVNAIIHMGAKPVFVDVDERGCLNPDNIQRAVTDKTKAIIPVHYAGAACRMGDVMQAAEHFKLTVIEDAAHAFGGDYIEAASDERSKAPRKLGTIGHFGVFSFYATKNITAGDGGMVLTKRGDWAERIRILTLQGQTSGAWGKYQSGPVLPYEIAYDGYKGSMTDIHAAIGLTQLRRWPELREKRAKVWKIYEEAFGLKSPGHSQHLYMIRVKNRDQFRQKMHELGIGTGIHYNPLHVEPAYRYLGYKKGQFPFAEKIGSEVVSLPVSATMSEDNARYVVDCALKLMEAVEDSSVLSAYPNVAETFLQSFNTKGEKGLSLKGEL